MYKNLLSKKFFKENPIKQITAQQLVFAKMDSPIIDQIALDISRRFIDRAEEEREKLLKEEDTDVLLKMMRGKCDVMNHSLLHEKVLEQEDILLPKVLEMLKSSGNDIFIENAVNVIVKAKKPYGDELFNILDNIRSPYALSLSCIALGFIGNEEVIPVLMEKFNNFKMLYPNESYEQGPLLGLIKLNERFYA